MKEDDHLERAIDYIENNLNGRIYMEALARSGFVSLMQLYREFYRMSGHSVKDYIRKRRVSNACAEIKYTERTVTEIALNNGFDSLPSFNKIFRKIVGIPPMQYRHSQIYYHFAPVQVLKEPFVQNIRVQARGELNGVSGIFPAAEKADDRERQALDSVRQALVAAKKAGIRFKLFGVTSVNEREQDFNYKIFIHTEEECDFWISALSEAGYYSVGYAVLGEGNFAECTVPFCGEAERGWDYLYSDWLPKSMFKMVGNQCYEEFVIQNNGAVKELRLLLPIEKTPETYKIEVTVMPEQKYLTARAFGASAEEAASRRLLSWVNNRGVLPKIFYIVSGANSYSCGIELPRELSEVACPNGLEIITVQAGLYATVAAADFGHYDGLAGLLNEWQAGDSRYTRTGELFALYCTDDDYESTSLTVCLPVERIFC